MFFWVSSFPSKAGLGRQEGRAGGAEGRTERLGAWRGSRGSRRAPSRLRTVGPLPPRWLLPAGPGECPEARAPWATRRASDCAQQPRQSPAAGLGPEVAVLLIVTLVSLSRLLKQKQVFLTTHRNGERKRERRDVCARRRAPAGSLQKMS